MYGDSPIAQHRLRPGCGNGDIIAGLAQGDGPVFVFLDVFIGLTICERVLEVPHVPVDLDILDFEVRDRGFEMGIPIHEALAAVDQPLVVHVHEHFDDSIVEVLFGRIRITGRAAHGEGLAGPIARCPQPLELTNDGAARILLLLPDAFQELLAAHFSARGLSLGGHVTLGHHLGGDAGVIRAWLPQRVKAAHSVPTDQDILQGVVECVPHVQGARHIWRGNHDRKTVCTRLCVCTGCERIRCLPGCKQAGLGFFGIEGFFHRHRVAPEQGLRLRLL